MRNLLKYNYTRTGPPARDWVIEKDFDLATADYRSLSPFVLSHREQFREHFDASRQFFWLCGLAEKHHILGRAILAAPAEALSG